MKISDLFKKKSGQSNFSNFNEMKKEQITKVLGGSGGAPDPNAPDPTPDGASKVRAHSNQSNN